MRATRQQELAKQMLPDPGQWAVNAGHLPGDLPGGFRLPWKHAAMSRKTLLFSTPGVWFQFMICIRESALDQFGSWKKKKKGMRGRANFFVHLPFAATLQYNLGKMLSASASPSVKWE